MCFPVCPDRERVWMRSSQGTFKHRRAMRSPPRSPGRLREDDAAAHAARVAEARAAYSRLSRAGGELNRELRPAARMSTTSTDNGRSSLADDHRSSEDVLRGLDSLAVAAGRRAPPRKPPPPPSSSPGDISAGPHEGWLGTVLARREDEEEVGWMVPRHFFAPGSASAVVQPGTWLQSALFAWFATSSTSLRVGRCQISNVHDTCGFTGAVRALDFVHAQELCWLVSLTLAGVSERCRGRVTVENNTAAMTRPIFDVRAG